MASIQKRGDSYRVRIIRKGYPAQTNTFHTKAEAFKWARLIETQIDQGLIATPRRESSPTLGKGTLFQEAAEHYIKTHSIHKGIVRSETYRLRILSKRWEGLTIYEIDKPAVLGLRDDLLKLGRANDTVNHYYNTLSKLYQMLADEWNLDIPNPVKGIKRQPQSQGRIKRLNLASEKALLDACDLSPMRELTTIVKIALATAMRRSELMNLEWSQIDLEGQKIYLDKTKNDQPRQVPVSNVLVQVLSEIERKDSCKVFPCGLAKLRYHFQRAIKIAGIKFSESENPFDNFTFHDLRHAALSNLSDLGLNTVELAAISGHTSLSMLSRYTHPGFDSLLNKLNQLQRNTT
jgi:integrase